MPNKKKQKPETKNTSSKKKVAKSELGFKTFLLICLLLSGLGIFILIQNNYAVMNDVKIRKVDESIQEEKMEQKALRLRLAKLKSPARVSRIARDELGLGDPGQLVYVKFTRDANGNMICQSSLEKRMIPKPPVKEEEQPAVKEEDNTSASVEESSTNALSQR